MKNILPLIFLTLLGSLVLLQSCDSQKTEDPQYKIYPTRIDAELFE